MSYINVKEFLTRFSKSSAPHEHTVRRWIDKRVLPGVKIGERYFIDDDALTSMGDPIVAKVLRDVSRST